MSATTIELPRGNATAYAARFTPPNSEVRTTRIDVTTLQRPTSVDAITTAAPASTELPAGFALYLPFVVTTATDVVLADLIAALDAPYPGNPNTDIPSPVLAIENGEATSIASTRFPFGAQGGTLYIPVTNFLGARVGLDGGIATLAALGTGTAPPGSLASNTEISSQSSTTSTGQISTPGHDQSSTQATTESSSSTPTSGGGGDSGGNSSSYNAGALAGGIVGAFLAALLLCALLWFFCIRRRRSRRSASQQRFSDSSNDYALADMARNPEKSQAVVAASAVTGWQKHLPQEKDDGTITKLFKSIFEQAQMHMEGYYGSNTQDLSDASIATLRELSEDDLPLMLSQTQKQVLLLEGILLRFMIRRISGRSDVQDSFLPGDLSRIAKNNKWYMERESGQSGVAASGKKRGFSQALAQWRQLTGFLLPNHRDDQAYQNELRTKIEAAVQNIDSAYSPWEISGKSGDKRRESLRGILQQVSDAGILLFTQPSTFLFDWSTPAQGDSRTVAISPALLRENEGSVREDILIKGSQGKL